MGKLVESILRNTPPLPPIFSAGCSKVRYTNELFPEATGVTAPVTFFLLTSAFRMYGLGVGRLSNTDSGTPKFFARISLGVCASQSSMLKVVLLSMLTWKLQPRQVCLCPPSRTQLCQNRRHQRQARTRSHPQDPVRYGRRPWGSTIYHHS
jgi:hypothetical protein